VTTHTEQDIIEIDVPLAGSGTDSTSRRALDALENQVIPATFGATPGTRAYVTGELASPSTSTTGSGGASSRSSCSCWVWRSS
jgi:hypothetical protein